jgi:hypothetical protein
MIYAINILNNTIKEHKRIINQLNETDPELICNDFFMESEIKEREGYITNLQEAIKTLSCYENK